LLQYRPELALLARAGIVHRLDKDTSGLLLVAGTLPAQNALTQMLAQRRLNRRYIAVTEGVVIAGRDIDLPLGRHPRQRTRQAVREGGRESLTKLQPLERYRSHSLVEAKLATGRTHQIRVHLSAIGHPLVGDRRYGARGIVPNRAGSMLVDCLRNFPRQALHARVLELDHPVTGRPLSFRSPIPADINTLLGLLRDDIAVPDET
jgi:23S rRNA pseudouridine1911/1915/1917 synthase